MKIINNVLISITEDDLIQGEFTNNIIIEVADKCFYDMKSLKKVNLPNVKKIGDDCFRYNQALTAVSLPALTTAVSDCFRSNQALTSVRIGKKKLVTKDVDGYCFVIEAEKTSKGIKIYTGYNFVSLDKKVISKKECFVAESGEFTAHGETVKQAISDLNFKVVSERLKKEPILPDTLVTVAHYRAITGACEFGVKDWMSRNGIVDEAMRADKLLPMLQATNAYGVDRFKELVKW